MKTKEWMNWVSSFPSGRRTRAAMRRGVWVGAVVLCCAALFACVGQRKAVESPSIVVQYERVSWMDLPGWQNDAVQEAWPAFLASCHALRFQPDWSVPCGAAESIGPNANSIRTYFKQYFEPYQIIKSTNTQREKEGLITGYYEPLLNGSRSPSERFHTPLLMPPPDLVTVDLASLYPELKGKRIRGRMDGKRIVPYFPRAQIHNNPAVRGLEIVWVDSVLDAFLLEIQGSGRVQLEDGEVIRIQYADQNGHPYRSIGRYLVTQEELTVEQATIPGIRAWLERNPSRLREVLNANPSVVFFNAAPLTDPREGPKGAQGVPLTAGRSIAVDPAYVPLGAPVYLATTMPDSKVLLRRLVIAQDTGGAVKSAPRADLFWGASSEAQELAGKMRQRGMMWLLWPRGMAVPDGH